MITKAQNNLLPGYTPKPQNLCQIQPRQNLIKKESKSHYTNQQNSVWKNKNKVYLCT